MIPKIIHYCWFGGAKKTEEVIHCLKSWEKHLPEYKIKEWNEDNFNIDFCPYVRDAYNARKFAFVSDVARLYALYHEGGLYMDTDVEVIAPLDCIMDCEAVLGMDSEMNVSTGLIASVPKMDFVGECLEDYASRDFLLPTGKLNTTTNVSYITDKLIASGLKLDNQKQTVRGLTILPWEYLSPKSVFDGKLYLTENSLAIHHFSGSWISPLHRSWMKFKKLIHGPQIKRYLKRLFKAKTSL